MKNNGWIALDIDGTITLDKYSVPVEVVEFLKSLSLSGWQISFATGRSFAFAQRALSKLNFPYTFFCQNGSIALEMPNEKILFTHYIPVEKIRLVEEAYRGIESDFLVYAGYELGDFCYWRSLHFSPEDRQYLKDLERRQKEKWQEVKDFNDLPVKSFPLIKCFGPKAKMQLVAERLLKTKDFEVAHIRDPFDTAYWMLLVTAKGATKGLSLKRALSIKGSGSLVIAAGDDENDLSLFDVADIKIAMPHAPKSLIDRADLIAPPTSENGIIQALKKVLRL